MSENNEEVKDEFVPLKEFTVKRSEWVNGSYERSFSDQGFKRDRGPSRLLNNKGFKCCLGFHALACGFTEDEIRDKPTPNNLIINLRQTGDKRVENLGVLRGSYDNNNFAHSSVCERIIATNDSSLNQYEIEAELTKLFAEIDITIKFED